MNQLGSMLEESSNEPGVTRRDDFSGMSRVDGAETAATAVAAKAAATVQARYAMALRRPRDLDSVRVRLLAECSRPGFAEVARYRKPVGKSAVEGPSIRFVEAAIRCMTNLQIETEVIFEDEVTRIVRVTVADIEGNVPYARDVSVRKTVERKQVRDGQKVFGERANSFGDRVFIVEATDDELLNKESALVSKALRTLGLRLVPGDIVEECMAKVVAVQRAGVKKDPLAARKALVDAFAERGIWPKDLIVYLGHDLDKVTEDELTELRALYTAMKEGEANWTEAVASKLAERGQDGAQRPAASASPDGGKGLAGLTAKATAAAPMPAPQVIAASAGTASTPAPATEAAAPEPASKAAPKRAPEPAPADQLRIRSLVGQIDEHAKKLSRDVMVRLCEEACGSLGAKQYGLASEVDLETLLGKCEGALERA